MYAIPSTIVNADEASIPKMTDKHDHIAFPWPSLPADIRLLILGEISGQKHCG